MFSKWLSNKTKTNRLEIAAPITGKAVELEQVPDEAFAGKHMGEGVAIEPTEGKLIAPFDGTVAHRIDTNHALILEHESGVQLLVHIGINTVALRGEGFTSHVSTGDRVTAGQTLIEFDIERIQEAGYPLITPVIIANGEESVSAVEYRLGPVRAGDAGLLSAVLKK